MRCRSCGCLRLFEGLWLQVHLDPATGNTFLRLGCGLCEACQQPFFAEDKFTVPEIFDKYKTVVAVAGDDEFHMTVHAVYPSQVCAKVRCVNEGRVYNLHDHAGLHEISRHICGRNPRILSGFFNLKPLKA